MLKVYRLLRNNKEIGPYTLEELLQLNLQTYDLIWVEGKSGSWAYPYEVEALKGHVAPPPPPRDRHESKDPTTHTHSSENTIAPKHIYVSLPTDARRQPAAGRRTDQQRLDSSYHPAAAGSLSSDDLQTTYARSLDEAEEAYTHWVYKQKSRTKPGARRYVLAAALLATVFTGGFFARQVLLKSSTPVALPAPAEATMPEVTNASLSTPLAESGSDRDEVTVTPTLPEEKPQEQTALRKEPKAQQVNSSAPAPVVAAVAPPAPTEAPKQHQEATPAKTVSEEVATTTSNAEEKKKKGFLGGLFRKKDKQEETVAENTPEEAPDTRKTRRRNTDAAPKVNLAERVELRPTTRENNWMLGVMGQKLTLYNNNQEAIKSATVEVSYYSEDNNLLGKKTMQFSNIAPKGTATAAVPDHQFAERASYRLVNATGASTAANQ